MRREENERLTRVGSGTPMGELLRRYWQPIAGVSELRDTPTKPIRIMGEDLVLYKDLRGNFGLLGRHCPHRGADLSYGYVEECGLRCAYHGWLFGSEGECLAQPFEDRVSGDRVTRRRVAQTAYPVRELAGLLYCYLGPLPAPELPNWELFDYQHGFKQIVFTEVPCNWLQIQENAIDPVHFEWLHTNWSVRQRPGPWTYMPTHRKLQVDEWDYGFIYRRLLDSTDESDSAWKYGRMCVLPNIFNAGGAHFEWRVPIDDYSTMSVIWAYMRLPSEREEYVQEVIPAWESPIADPDTGRLLQGKVVNQDVVAWVGQGEIANREQEHLGRSDVGVVKLRRQLERDMQAVERGEDPKGVIRDPEQAKLVEYPDDRRRYLTAGRTRAEMAQTPGANPFEDDGGYFDFLVGQPAWVAEQYVEAMGGGFDELMLAAQDPLESLRQSMGV